jgi:Icc protein
MVAAVPKPTLLVQLSDLHLGAAWEGVDPTPRLERVVEALLALPNPPTGIVVTGDLSDDGSAESYGRVRRLLEPLEAPVHPLPGNHDDRRRLREAFELPGEGVDPINYSVAVGDLRLVLFDSTVPGRDPGAFGHRQLDWLDAELRRETAAPTILAMHHPPLPTGVPEWDAINLLAAERKALAEVVVRHRQLMAIVGGHLHRTAAATLAGCAVFSVPSTYLQALPDYEPADFDGEDMVAVGPPGFALHVFCDGDFSSQAELLGPSDGG